jgi:hypothetical protein
VRSGLAATVQNPARDKLRAITEVSLTVRDDKGGSKVVSKKLTLRGPSDILGLEAAQIIRRYPDRARPTQRKLFWRNRIRPAGLPWLFTPATSYGADNGARSWLVLVVLEALRPFDPRRRAAGPRPSARRAATAHRSWAFAHAQVAGRHAAPRFPIV